MLSPRHILLTVGLALPALAQSQDWAVNFWTTKDCETTSPFTRLSYDGYSGHDNGDCIIVTQDFADCTVTHSGTGNPNVPDGIGNYPCTGPNSKGISGAPLQSFSGGGSCDFYTDSKCSQGHVHINLGHYTDIIGFTEPICYNGKTLLTRKYYQSFKCQPPSK